MAGDDEKNDEEKDLELDFMAEQELLRLTRQFRVILLQAFKQPRAIFDN